MSKYDTAVVLAGGKSSRLTFDKQTIRINGELMPIYIANCLAAEFEKVLIVSNKPELYPENCPYEIIPDKYMGLGPKAGILAGLEHTTSEFVYFTGCDMPYVTIPFIQYMKQVLHGCAVSPSVVVALNNGYFEPLNAFYSQTLKPCIEIQLQANRNKISDLYREDEMLCIDEYTLSQFDPHNLMFINLNTPEDYRKLMSQPCPHFLSKQNL